MPLRANRVKVLIKNPRIFFLFKSWKSPENLMLIVLEKEQKCHGKSWNLNQFFFGGNHDKFLGGSREFKSREGLTYRGC